MTRDELIKALQAMPEDVEVLYSQEADDDDGNYLLPVTGVEIHRGNDPTATRIMLSWK